MKHFLHSMSLADERGVVNARQRARTIAGALGFDHHDQIRLATAVSEIARNAFRYARDGAVSFSVDPETRIFWIAVTDHGSGIPHLDVVMAGSYRSTTGMGMGLLGTKRLMDEFSIESTKLGTSVEFGKQLPAHSPALMDSGRQDIIAEISRQHPATPIDELQTQNRELLRTLDELRERKEELVRINSELQDTNRGVVALYAELDERADYLRRASELKTNFLSNMSHEFRTPLNSMLALTQMLLDRMDGELTEEQEQQVQFIRRSAKELSDMVDDLLDIAKVEAGRLDVKPNSFSIPALFGALRGMLKPLLAESRIQLIFTASETLPQLFTDEQKVSQVLRNFISNAIKFTPEGTVTISAEVDGSVVIFSVADTGIGISESDQRMVFEEFSQVESSMQKRVKGTGLGLPLSRKLAELLGGTVEVESSVGVGSTFRLRVPMIYDQTLFTQTSIAPLPASDKKLVLIVEDNEETSFVYSRYLTAAGFQSQRASSIETARNLLTSLRPAAIILDLQLGTNLTWDFLVEVKSRANPTPVLVMSISEDRHRIFSSGADAYLSKPFDPAEMVEKVRQLTATTNRQRILMIDDNEVSRYLLRGYIDESIFEIFEAVNGRDGLRLAEHVQPDLIFLDFYMPDLDGMDVLKSIRRIESLSDTPVVLHSTKNLDDSETAFIREQSTIIFTKQSLSLPDPADRVRRLIASLLSPRVGEVESDV
ncbi:response regulator [Edaphobacter sp. HDX4]|uniref:ATP-binding protein n=1 Tax=Edaphobacter sp. HDX4 TaxID=2794064 RepID=UPI002FE654F9